MILQRNGNHRRSSAALQGALFALLVIIMFMA